MLVYLLFRETTLPNQEFLNKIPKHVFIHWGGSRNPKGMPGSKMFYFAMLRAFEENLKSSEFIYRPKYIIRSTSSEFGFATFWFGHTENLTDSVLQC